MVIGFWSTQDEYGCFSNWFRANIVIDGKTFSCCEQYMMYEKAKLFKDEETANKIDSFALGPREIKALGRQVKNFDPIIWDKVKETIVGTAVLAKFIQYPDLWKKLDSTGDNTIVEASPYDTIWGIGLSTSAAIQDEANWRGTNLLGKITIPKESFNRYYKEIKND